MKMEIEQLIFLLNPWLSKPASWKGEVKKRLPSQFIARNFLETAKTMWVDHNKAHLIVGPRQSGKSTAVWKFLSDKNGRVLFLNCEESLVREWCTSPAMFIDDIKSISSQIDYIFFDEAQYIKEAGLFLKGLIDYKINKSIIVTGSSSYHLHAKTRESLAGRATRTLVTPLTIAELSYDIKSFANGVQKKLTHDLIEQQQRYGSYPGVWLAKNKEEILFNLIEAFVIRDASDLFRVRHVGAFRQLLKLLSWQIGKLVNYSEWGSIAGIDYHTVKNYLDMLDETHIISVVQPFAGGKRAELTSNPVVYFNDLGLRNAFTGQFTPLDERMDRGEVFQNWVFGELLKMLPRDVSIRFWRTKSGSESDFVLVRGNEISGVEVKCAVLTEGKISKSSRSYIDAYKPKTFFIVNRGYEGEAYVGHTRVFHLKQESIFEIVKYFLNDVNRQ